MQNKVTSYELSKQLAEAGFDSDSHCGFYDLCHHDGNYYWTNLDPRDRFDHSGDIVYKAYDCFDLLMWLREEGYNISFEFYTTKGLVGLSCNGEFYKEDLPQEALGQAVLKVVQGE